MVIPMVDSLEKIISAITDIMRASGPIAGFLIIILESIIPILPLGAFIALNNIVFGPVWDLSFRGLLQS
jgi:hypothetical protein